MAINYTTKYSPLISERFKQQSLTEKWAGKKFDFDGAQSVVVYTVDKVTLNNYNRTSSTNRYGSVTELGDTKQTLTMSQDKSFTFAIDHGNSSDQVNIKHCNEQLKSNWDEVCTPEIDKYRFNVWANGAGITFGNEALTKSNIVEKIMTVSGAMSNKLVPRTNRAIFIAESLYIQTKLSSEIAGIDTLGRAAIANGVVGYLDGMEIVAVPDVYLPAGVQFIIKHRDATADPMKIKTMRVQKNPLGFDADIGECRFYHDAFVLDAKCHGIAVYSTNVADMPSISIASNKATITATDGAIIKYTTDGSNPKSNPTASNYSSPVTVAIGGTIRAYATLAGKLSSGVSEAKNG